VRDRWRLEVAVRHPEHRDARLTDPHAARWSEHLRFDVPTDELESVGRKRLAPGGEQRISSWIQQHLSVAVHPYPNRDALEYLEHRVLETLDPRK
jgi:hypothetical protein